MVIRILDQNYFVTETLPSETGLLQYVCRKVSEDDGKEYRIVRIPLEEAKPGLVRWLSANYRKGNFRELTQYANEQGHLLVVADCGNRKARPLSELLREGAFSLRERLIMGKKLLERLILSDVPNYFALYAMDTDHVRFTEALDCCFTFELEHLPRFCEAEAEDVQRRLKNVLSELFREELKDGKIPEMQAFLDRISQREFPEMMDICRAYRPIAEELSGKDEETLDNQSLPFRVWETIKRIAAFLRRILFLVVFAIAIAYLVLSIRDFLAPAQQADTYKSIGNLTIESHMEGAENE